MQGCRILHTSGPCDSCKMTSPVECGVYFGQSTRLSSIAVAKSGSQTNAVVSSSGFEVPTRPLLKWTMSVMDCCGVPDAEGKLLQCCA